MEEHKDYHYSNSSHKENDPILELKENVFEEKKNEKDKIAIDIELLLLYGLGDFDAYSVIVEKMEKYVEGLY